MEPTSSTPSERILNWKTVRKLARYAAFAHFDSNDSALFHVSAPDLRGPVEFRKVDLEGPLASLQHTWIHLGIRNEQTLVIAIGSCNDFLASGPSALLGRLPLYSIAAARHFNPRPIDWVGDVPEHECPRVDGQYLLIFDELRQSLHQRLCALLQTIRERAPNIEICGYGEAGALATLCASWCATQWKHAVTCVTLGSPMVGDCNFAREFRSRNITCYRLVLRSDAATPVFNAPIWEHVGTEIRLPRLEENFWSRVADVVIACLAVLGQSLTLCWTFNRVFSGEWTVFPMFWLSKALQLVSITLNTMACDPCVYLTGVQNVMEDAMGFKVETVKREIKGRTVTTIWLKEPERGLGVRT